jgi:hypothetical protein
MLRRMLCSSVCVAGLAGTILLSGCGGGGVDRSGPATPPQSMDPQKQKQYQDFMNRSGAGAAGGARPGAPGGAPAAPGGAPGSPPPGNAPMPPHG